MCDHVFAQEELSGSKQTCTNLERSVKEARSKVSSLEGELRAKTESHAEVTGALQAAKDEIAVRDGYHPACIGTATTATVHRQRTTLPAM